MGYYRFTQWTTREIALKIARNSNFPVWMAKTCPKEYRRGTLFCVVKQVKAKGETFERVLELSELEDDILK